MRKGPRVVEKGVNDMDSFRCFSSAAHRKKKHVETIRRNSSLVVMVFLYQFAPVAEGSYQLQQFLKQMLRIGCIFASVSGG